MANKIHQITVFVEKRKLGFGVARLLMLSGVDLRQFSAQSPDNAGDFDRVWKALPAILSPQELRELEHQLNVDFG
jgi:hypothetical protein